MTDTNQHLDSFLHDRTSGGFRLVSHAFGDTSTTPPLGVQRSLGFAGDGRMLLAAGTTGILPSGAGSTAPELLMYDLATTAPLYGLDVFLYRPDSLFADGFESGDLSAWSAAEP